MTNAICSNDYLVKKLVCQNTKNSSNGELFKKAVADAQKACLEWGQNFEFDITQTRTKFTSCVSWCKTAAMTFKTATGIQRFQDDKNLGCWFNQLFPLGKSRESAQPEQAIEPSACQEVAVDEKYDEDSTHGFDFQSDTQSPCSSNSVPSSDQRVSRKESKNFPPKRKNLAVPVKTCKKKKSDLLAEAVSSFNKMLDSDPTKELLEFFKEENEKSREQELEIFKSQLQSQMQMQMQMLSKIFGNNSYDWTPQNYSQQQSAYPSGRHDYFNGCQSNSRSIDSPNHQQRPQQFEMNMGSPVSESVSASGKTYMNLL